VTDEVWKTVAQKKKDKVKVDPQLPEHIRTNGLEMLL
jgi:hypothetical protein